MEKRELSFESSTGLDRIACSIWMPEGKPRAVVQISHGMSEYVDRYQKTAKFLAEQGFLVCGNDHLGHGKAAVKQGTQGYFGEEKGWIHMVDDMHRLTAMVQEEWPEIPFFLLGHSMGSLLARAYISVYGEELAGTLIIGTSGNAAGAALGLPIVRIVRKHKGSRKSSKFLYAMAFGAYNRKFLPERDRLAWMSRDPEVLRRFRNDERSNFMFTTAGFEDLLSVLRYVSTKNWAQMVPVDLPICLMCGDMDPVGNYGKDVHKVYTMLEDAGVKDVEMIMYEDFRHEILNEPDGDVVRSDILSWLENRL